MNWFTCLLSYEKLMENGTQQKVTEPYLVDALSFTETEARIIEEIKPYISGEFTIADIKRARIAEIFFNESGDRYYQAKVTFITLDEKTGAEKRTSAKMIIQASDFDEAIQGLKTGMAGTMADWVLSEMKETQIMDIFRFEEKEKKEITFEHLNIADKMLKAKKFVMDQIEKQESVHKVADTQQLIINKANNDPEKYLSATIGLMKENEEHEMLVLWILGCSTLLIESNGKKDTPGN